MYPSKLEESTLARLLPTTFRVQYTIVWILPNCLEISLQFSLLLPLISLEKKTAKWISAMFSFKIWFFGLPRRNRKICEKKNLIFNLQLPHFCKSMYAWGILMSQRDKQGLKFEKRKFISFQWKLIVCAVKMAGDVQGRTLGILLHNFNFSILTRTLNPAPVLPPFSRFLSIYRISY